jgi:hypothetical protein
MTSTYGSGDGGAAGQSMTAFLQKVHPKSQHHQTGEGHIASHINKARRRTEYQRQNPFLKHPQSNLAAGWKHGFKPLQIPSLTKTPANEEHQKKQCRHWRCHGGRRSRMLANQVSRRSYLLKMVRMSENTEAGGDGAGV